MTAVSYVPPNVLPPVVQKLAPLLKRRWIRELVLMPPTLSGQAAGTIPARTKGLTSARNPVA